MWPLVFCVSPYHERSIVPGNGKCGGRKSISLKKESGFLHFWASCDLAALVTEILCGCAKMSNAWF